MIKALLMCISAKAEASKLNKRVKLTSLVKSGVSALSGDSSKVSHNIVFQTSVERI